MGRAFGGNGIGHVESDGGSAGGEARQGVLAMVAACLIWGGSPILFRQRLIPIHQRLAQLSNPERPLSFTSLIVRRPAKALPFTNHTKVPPSLQTGRRDFLLLCVKKRAGSAMFVAKRRT